MLLIAIVCLLAGCQQPEIEWPSWDRDAQRYTIQMSSWDKLEKQRQASLKPVSLEQWEIEILSKCIAIWAKKTGGRQCIVLTMQAQPLQANVRFALKCRNPTIKFIASSPHVQSSQSCVIQFEFPLDDRAGQQKARLSVTTDQPDTVDVFRFLAERSGDGWVVEFQQKTRMYELGFH